ncbi:DUF305 domain-containing protein [Kribbella sp. NPDC050820]|uniref:DUF305 domain-containing protein n=1 Tax=Kribbella sp. NPDC050820 TaxID=3155408 RepID=UPI0034067339
MKRVFSTTVLVLALAGCGEAVAPEPGSTATAAAFNDADVRFASQMIPHHQQAVQMASMAGYQATTPEVKRLAVAIKAAQDPEIKVMSGWLTTWGKPVPSPEHGGHGAAEEAPGMMGEEEMSELGKAKGAAFDQAWMQLMIRHHQGAVTMATAEQKSGKDPAAIALAKKIQAAQTAEITTMQNLLKNS